ncbi:MAG: replication initiator protein A, partial [Planctomycetota bacterium]
MKTRTDSQPSHRRSAEDPVVIPLFGKDEMNLVEFPICPLSPTDEESIEIVHEVRDRNTKRLVKRGLLITGTKKFGLPRPFDEQVLLGLSSLTHENGATNRKVHFSQYQLLQTIGWPTDGRAYRRLGECFDRLTSVYLKFSNAWWDKTEREYRSHGFHLIESYELCSLDRYSNRRNRTGQRSQPLSSFVWSEVMWKSIGDGYIRSIDMELFRKIARGRRREVPIRLFRWLGKKFWPLTKQVVRFDLLRLAEGTLGLAERYPSQVKRVLERAAQVLIDVGYLSEFQVVERRGGCGWDAVFVRRSVAARKPTLITKPKVFDSQQRLENDRAAAVDEIDAWMSNLSDSALNTNEQQALDSGFGTEFERKHI